MLMHRLVTLGAERHPDRPAFHWVDRDRGLTYAGAVDAMERMAGALHDLGVRKGDRVTVFAHNGLDYVVAMLGAWRIGAIAALVNVKFADELTDYFADHTPSVVIYTHDMEAQVAAAAAATGVRHRLCMDGAQDGALPLPDLLAAALPAPPDPGDESAIAHLSYTSGTTGRPKGACLAHEPTVRAARCIGERLRLRSSDVSFGPSALSSSYQLVANLLPPLAVGASINVMRFWTQEGGYDALARRGATMLVANPPILDDVLREARRRGAPPPALRLGLSGGGPVPPLLKAAWRDAMRLPLVESYGQSELGGFVGLGYPELEPDDGKLGRVGPPLPDKEVAILGPDDRALPAGEIGEITVTGGFMAGYWDRAEKTQEATRGGRLRTGDLGLLDADGHVTLRSRRAELVEVAGRLWYPRDVEEALMAEAGVAQAALVGVAHDALGQRPVAFAMPQPGASLDGSALKAAIAACVPYDLAPLAVVVVSELPMTPTGKIAKAELARSDAALRAAEAP
ncbi:class I adenylate-forming enzyme family protein [uncultured Methylobacterium sp.]|uniref:class I adenylate-forming enzyme family protein n=1 Tax=uncultured Methylobacterium sp. TaxID=157278 RepID=UPI0035CC4BA7